MMRQVLFSKSVARRQDLSTKEQRQSTSMGNILKTEALGSSPAMTPGSSGRNGPIGLIIVLATVKSQIPLAEQFRMQAAEALADADTLRKMRF